MSSKKIKLRSRLKQSSLLDGLNRFDRKEKDLTSVIALEEDDPYKFVDSQSMEPGDDMTPYVPKTPKPLPPGRGGRGGASLNTPTPGPVEGSGSRRSKRVVTASSSSLSSTSTPTQQQGGAKSKHGKPKKSPASLTEEERLRIQEENDLKRAIEASRQDKERQERKRKRESKKTLQAAEEQGAVLENLQKRVKQAMAALDSVKNLKEGKTPTESNKSHLKDQPVSVAGAADAIVIDDITADADDIMCDDPPSLRPGDSPPPLTPPPSPPQGGLLSMATERPADTITPAQLNHATTLPSTSDATPPTAARSSSPPVPTRPLPLSQLKSVSIRKLSVKKFGGRGPTGSRTRPSSRVQGCKDLAEHESEEVVTPALTRIKRPRPSPVATVTDSSHQEKEGDDSAIISDSTPALVRCGQTGEWEEPLGTGDDTALTPPMTSAPKVHTSSSTRSECPETVRSGKEEGTPSRPVRRNLSLSYKKRQGTRTRVTKPADPDHEPAQLDCSNEKTCLSDPSHELDSSRLSQPDSEPVQLDCSSGRSHLTHIDETIMIPTVETCGNTPSRASAKTPPSRNGLTAIPDTVVAEDVSTGPVDAVKMSHPSGEGTDVDIDNSAATNLEDVNVPICVDLCEDEEAMPPAAATPPDDVMDVDTSTSSSSPPGPSAVSTSLQERALIQLPRDGQEQVKLQSSTVLSTQASPSAGSGADTRPHPPPLLFAEGPLSPTQCSKLIVRSFNSYFSQLARAQSQVAYRVRWGKPVLSNSKQSATTLFFSPRRGRSARCVMDDCLRLSLSLNVSKRSTSPNSEAEDVVFRLSEEEGEGEGHGCERVGGAAEEREGDELWEVDSRTKEDFNESSEENRSRKLDANTRPDVTEPSVDTGTTTWTGGMRGGGGGVTLVEEGLGDDDHIEHDELNPETVVISTQEESHPPAKDLPGRESEHSPWRRQGGAAGEVSKDAESPLDSTPHMPDSDLDAGSEAFVDRDRSPLQRKKVGTSSPWLSSRKPPPSAARKNKTTRATARPKTASLVRTPLRSGGRRTGGGAKGGGGGARGGGGGARGGGGGGSGKGSAAARLILQQQRLAQSSDGSNSDDGETMPPAGQLDMGRGRGRGLHSPRAEAKRMLTDSDSSEESEVGTRKISRCENGASHPAPNRSPKVIDLTEDPLKKTAAGPSSSKHSCPICSELFRESEIEAHVNMCLENPRLMRSIQREDEGEGKAWCGSCGKVFERALLRVHQEQCDGRTSSSEEEDLPPVGKKRRLVETRKPTRQGDLERRRKAADYQTTLADFQPPSSQESEDNESDDVMEVPRPGAAGTSSNTPLREATSRWDDHASHTSDQPQAIPCPDGGYMIDPETISHSPIRCFTSLSSLDPEERGKYQNQFRSKGGGASGRRKQQLSFQERAGPGWSERSKRRGNGGKYGGNGKWYGRGKRRSQGKPTLSSSKKKK